MTDATGPRPVRWRRKFLIAGGALALLAVIAAFGHFFYHRYRANAALEAAIADADRQDPDWRLEQIEAKRAKVPPADNAAIAVLKARAMLPKDWDRPAYEMTGIVELLPNTPLDAKETEYHRKIVKPLQGVAPIAQEALPLKQGWIAAVEWKPPYMPPVHDIRPLVEFLQYHAALCSQDGDPDNAWKSGLTILAVSRAIGQEPSGTSQLERLAYRNAAIASLERTLALAPKSVSAELLEQGQRDVAEEAARPALLIMLRGHRAWLHLVLTDLEASKLGDVFERHFRDQDLSDLSFFLQTGSTCKLSHAWLLDHYNKAIDIAKLPAHEQLPQLKSLEKTWQNGPPGLKKGIAGAEASARADLNTQARLRCAVAAIAVERFRVAKGTWPASLEDVVAAMFLDKVPLDVFDGKPLRYRKTNNGVVVYSVGPDATYQGDALDTAQDDNARAGRHEFRLWDPDQRRKGPRPPPPQQDHPGD
jgi:hypothetical protein